MARYLVSGSVTPEIIKIYEEVEAESESEVRNHILRILYDYDAEDSDLDVTLVEECEEEE